MNRKQKIIVLTYNVPHRKTYDVLCLLKSRGYENVHIYAKPMHYKKKKYPLICHRPDMPYNIPPKQICTAFDYEYQEISEYDDKKLDKNGIYLICGAGILPDDFISNRTIINAHPGYIPNCRGLDALKWAIWDGEPIGVTAHLIGDEVDAGIVLIRKTINVSEYDTFHSVATKVYESEISALVDAVEEVCEGRTLGVFHGNNFEVHKRMPEYLEKDLFKKFEQYKKRNTDTKILKGDKK